MTIQINSVFIKTNEPPPHAFLCAARGVDSSGGCQSHRSRSSRRYPYFWATDATSMSWTISPSPRNFPLLPMVRVPWKRSPIMASTCLRCSVSKNIRQVAPSHSLLVTHQNHLEQFIQSIKYFNNSVNTLFAKA